MRRGTRAIAVIAAVVVATATGAPAASATTGRTTQTRLALQAAGVAPGSPGVALPERGSTIRTGDLSIDYPQAARTSRSIDAHTRVFDGRHFDQVVQSTGRDHVRLLTILTDASAPTTYDYSFTGHELRAIDDGYVAVLNEESGEPVAVIEPAWAKDAHGHAVPTRYEIHDSTLTQVVDTDEHTAYPVVADPSVKRHWWGQDIRFSKRETKAIAVSFGACGTLLGMIPSIPTAIISGICRVATLWASAAAYHHRCIATKRLWTGQVIPWYWHCRW